MHTPLHPQIQQAQFWPQILLNASMNPYIKNKLRSCQISNLQNIFTFVLEEDQIQKIRALDFETKADTIAHCEIQAIKGSTCQKCGNEGHLIKDCPLLPRNNPIQHHNPIHQITNIQMHPTVGQIAPTTDMLVPITQTLNNLLDQLKQLCTTNTSSHSTFFHHQCHLNNTDRHRHKYHNRDTKHNSYDNYNGDKS